MANGVRRGLAVGRLLWVIPILLCACSKKQIVREEPPRAAVAEMFLFLSAVQGNPLCTVFDMEKHRSSRLFSSAPKTGWRARSWLVSPGLATYLGSQKGKAKQGAMAPVTSIEKSLFFTTDKEEFLYYTPTEAGKILLLTDPLFADRVRGAQEEEIRYGRMPARLVCNNRTIQGSLFYQRWAWLDPPERGRRGPFFGLQPGGSVFVLWGPGGEFLYLERGGEGGEVLFAVMQDRRGRWQETYQVRWSEPECAFSSAPCPEGSGQFRVGIPAWEVDGTLARLDRIAIPPKAAAEDGAAAEEEGEALEGGSAAQETFWTLVGGIPQAKGDSPVDFCLLKGSLWVDKDQRAVYGLGLRAKAP